MSKFTKALEKIQKEKNNNIRPKKPVSIHDLSELTREKTVSWDHGMATSRNSSPDRRIVTHHFTDSIISI